MLLVSASQVWLFTGDSITDYGRARDKDGWGNGYVRIIAQWLSGRSSAGGAGVPKILNRATSGNTVLNLHECWQEDVLALLPDVVSVKIGTNDVWAGLVPERAAQAVPIERFADVYNDCLLQLRRRHSACRLVLCEPCGIWPPASAQGNAALQPYLTVIRQLAIRHNAYACVPLHQVFLDAMKEHPEIDYLADGVHPTPPGDMLIAIAWLRAVGLIPFSPLPTSSPT